MHMVVDLLADLVEDHLNSQSAKSPSPLFKLLGTEDVSNRVRKKNKYVITRKNQKRARKSIVRWFLKVKWTTGEINWVPLWVMKENYPVQLTEYSVSSGIDSKPSFSWWVPYTLQKRDAILSSIKAHLCKTSVKYGVKIPRNIAKARQIDEENKNTLWQDAKIVK